MRQHHRPLFPPCTKPRGLRSAFLLLAAVLLVICPACVQSEDIEFSPDQLRERNRLLTACGEGQLTAVNPEDSDLARMLDAWREAVRRWQGYSPAQAERLITPSRIRYLDGVLVVDAYYLLEWLYLPFYTRTEIADPTDRAALVRALGESLRASGVGPLPGLTPPMSRADAHSSLETGCGLRVSESDCPPLRASNGELWYEPLPVEAGLEPPALRLRDGGLCCSGLDRGCL